MLSVPQLLEKNLGLNKAEGVRICKQLATEKIQQIQSDIQYNDLEKAETALASLLPDMAKLPTTIAGMNQLKLKPATKLLSTMACVYEIAAQLLIKQKKSSETIKAFFLAAIKIQPETPYFHQQYIEYLKESDDYATIKTHAQAYLDSRNDDVREKVVTALSNGEQQEKFTLTEAEKTVLYERGSSTQYTLQLLRAEFEFEKDADYKKYFESVKKLVRGLERTKPSTANTDTALEKAYLALGVKYGDYSKGNNDVGKMELALGYFEKAIARYQSPKAYFYAGCVCDNFFESTYDANKAKEYYLKAGALGIFDGYYNHAYNLRTINKKYDEALHYLSKAKAGIESTQGSQALTKDTILLAASTQLEIAMCFESKGDLVNARAHFVELKKIMPAWADARLVQLDEQEEKYADAYQRSLEMLAQQEDNDIAILYKAKLEAAGHVLGKTLADAVPGLVQSAKNSSELAFEILLTHYRKNEGDITEKLLNHITAAICEKGKNDLAVQFMQMQARTRHEILADDQASIVLKNKIKQISESSSAYQSSQKLRELLDLISCEMNGQNFGVLVREIGRLTKMTPDKNAYLFDTIAERLAVLLKDKAGALQLDAWQIYNILRGLNDTGISLSHTALVEPMKMVFSQAENLIDKMTPDELIFFLYTLSKSLPAMAAETDNVARKALEQLFAKDIAALPANLMPFLLQILSTWHMHYNTAESSPVNDGYIKALVGHIEAKQAAMLALPNSAEQLSISLAYFKAVGLLEKDTCSALRAQADEKAVQALAGLQIKGSSLQNKWTKWLATQYPDLKAEHPIGCLPVDIYLPSNKVVVQINGPQHYLYQDRERACIPTVADQVKTRVIEANPAVKALIAIDYTEQHTSKFEFLGKLRRALAPKDLRAPRTGGLFSDKAGSAAPPQKPSAGAHPKAKSGKKGNKGKKGNGKRR